jgi:hypothetical protein
MSEVASVLPLTTLLSQTLVAHTIELDNEAERRLPHRTSNHDDPSGQSEGPWLVSDVMWANVLRYVEAEAITVGQLEARARTSGLQLSGLRRWGYVSLSAPTGQALRSPPSRDTTVTLRAAGRRAATVWRTVPHDIDERWRARFGAAAVDRLTSALGEVFAALDLDPPDYLPIISPTQNGKAELPARLGAPEVDRRAADRDLSALLSGVLFGLTLDVERQSAVSLPICANTLRVVESTGVRRRDLPALTGVSKEGNAMCIGWLERTGRARTEPDSTAARGKVLHLTAKGVDAQETTERILDATESEWRHRHGAANIDELRAALTALVGGGTLETSPLASCLDVGPGRWRAAVRRPSTLPHYPMVLHRGGYPDGS